MIFRIVSIAALLAVCPACPDMTTIIQAAAYQHAALTDFSWCY